MSFAPARIASRQHALVRECRALARAPGEGRVLLDGAHLVIDALAAGATLEAVLATTTALETEPTLVPLLAEAGAPVYEAAASVLDAASPAQSPTGLVAIARWAPAALSSLFLPAPALVVGLVDVQDPGNVGGVIRAADALGATGVATVGQSAHPGGWKALRGAMGSVFRVPVARTDLSSLLSAAEAAEARVIATVVRRGREPHAVPLHRSTLLLVGHEGAGLPADLSARANDRVSIVMRPGVDSLNVGIAAALLLDEARRQRLAADASPRPQTSRP